MVQQTKTQSNTISRRRFCQSAVVTAATLNFAKVFAEASEMNKIKFYKNMGQGHIGVNVNQRQALEYAMEYGFEAITPNVGEFENKSTAEINEWVGMMKEKGIRYGTSGLPVDFRGDDNRFQNGLAKLPKQARVLEQMNVNRMATWVLPGHNELTYLQNLGLHIKRLSEVAKVLKDNNIRLGLEFVGPKTSRARSRFPFICTQMGMMELVRAIGTGNVGLLMDSWHWYTSHGTVDELLRLTNNDIVHVHINDAPSGVPVDEQIDNRRALPAATGVIDMKGFINALVKIGYDGPVECEPFDNELRDMEDTEALKKTIDSLNRVWELITV